MDLGSIGQELINLQVNGIRDSSRGKLVDDCLILSIFICLIYDNKLATIIFILYLK